MNRRLAELQQSLHAKAASRIFSYGPLLDLAPLDLDNPLIDLDCTGKYLLCTNADGHIRMYQLSNTLRPQTTLIGRSESPVFSHDSFPNAMEWYPTDNKLFLTTDVASRMNVWDAAFMTIVDSFTMQKKALTLNICPASGGECLVAVGLVSGGTAVYDIRTGTRVDLLRLQSPHGDLYGDIVVSWSPIQRHLLVTSESKRHPVVWDTRLTRQPLKQLQLEMRANRRMINTPELPNNAAVMGGRFTRDGMHYIVIYGNGLTAAWKFPSMNLKLQHYFYPLAPPPNSTLSIRFDILEEPCFTKSLLFCPNENEVQVFSFEEKKVVACHQVHLRSIRMCILRRCFNQIITCSYDSTCHMLGS
ncbi:DNA excision repair protein ERCC-8 [Trichuris trichiura]|uniref:DNA excision repair protein ERCC-8 n=1 Tax=Trichuris trichiura TaxID=36087 RepID=A0A077YW09_TRITR|nr:DNA excision repair protein ERCC-8 [Trichuris trichiura]